MRALPVGASAAVHNFNRAAQAIEAILVRIFGIPCTHYFDDFTFDIPSCLCDVVTKGIRDVLGGLGRGIKEGKGNAFSSEFEALGVTFDTRNAAAMVPI